MKVSDKLGDLYGGYYDLGGGVAQKRAVAARQTIGHIKHCCLMRLTES
jgi:hypothetical protein